LGAKIVNQDDYGNRINHIPHPQLRLSTFLLLLLASVFLIAPTACAQGRAPYSFPSENQKVLDRLGALARITDGEWSYHAGDVPHGEDPALDTSAWQRGKPPLITVAGSVWFRREIEVPESLNGYGLRGASITFQFRSMAHGGVSEIIYVNGRRVALGEALEPVVLFDNIQGGEKALVAVKLLQSADVKTIGPEDLRVQFASSRPDPVAFRAECESLAALLPSITPAGEQLRAQKQMLEQAVHSIDVAALDNGQQDAFDASLRNAQQQLDPLRSVVRQLRIDLVGHSHIDAAWLWPWTETVDVVRRTFSTALQLMPEYPQYKYTQSAAQYDEWMQEKYPDIFGEMKSRVAEGRWELVGGMWVEPDLNMPDGESLVRQILIGKRYMRQQLGVDVHIGWNPDSFGYTWQLPQIYKKSGIDYFVTQKMAWNETTKLTLKLFWWQSPDGSRVLTYFPHGYGSAPDPESLANDIAVARGFAPGEDELMHIFGVGDHGGGPTRTMLDEGLQWMQPDKVYPGMQYTTAGDFFSAVSQRVDTSAPGNIWNYRTLAAGQTQLPAPAPGKISVPVWNDELYLEFHRGVFTTQAAHKRNMRESEEWMLNAEKTSAIAWLGGETYPTDKLTEAWKKVLFNQFHDLAAGSGIADIYVDAQRDYDAVHAVAEDATRTAMQEITAHADTQVIGNDDAAVVVFNPLAWPRTDLVEADVQLPHPSGNAIVVRRADGSAALSQVLASDAATGRYHLLIRAQDVPSMGYTVLQASPGVAPATSDLSIHETTLENSLLRVEIDPKTGCIVHLIDKKSSFDSIAPGGCGNELERFTDLPQRYDAWNIDAGALGTMVPIREADSVQVIDHGPLRASVRIKRHWNHSTFTQDIVLYAGIARVDVVNDFDWHEQHVLLKAAFPLASSSAQATYEIPYGTIERPTTRDNPIEKAKFEVPALRWADLGDEHHGFSLINESKYGYDAAGNVLRLSLLRSPTYPDPNADQGHQHFAYSLYPHSGTWQQAMTVRRGYEFNYKLQATQAEQHAGALGKAHSFLHVDDDAVVLTAMKKSEDGNALILRLYDWSGKPSVANLTLPGAPAAVNEADMMEQPGKSDGQGQHVSVTFAPYEIKTLRVEYEPGEAFWTPTRQ
jgi:alpha-mannosidase